MSNIQSFINYNDYKFDTNMLGYVLLENKELRIIEKDKNISGVGTYIPKIMTEINMKNNPYIEKKSLSSAMIKNKNTQVKFPKQVEVCNYIIVQQPKFITTEEQKCIKKNTCISIQTENGDIHKIYYTGLAKNNY